jgi:hypothetical protein
VSTDFVITAENQPQKFFDVSFKGAAKTYSFDFSPWAEDNHDVTTATWEVITGTATVSGTTLVSNLAAALVTFPSEGGQLLKLTSTTSAEKYVAYLDILVKDPQAAVEDYRL